MKQGDASWLTFTHVHAELLPGLCHARQPKVMQVGAFCTHTWLMEYSFVRQRTENQLLIADS